MRTLLLDDRQAHPSVAFGDALGGCLCPACPEHTSNALAVTDDDDDDDDDGGGGGGGGGSFFGGDLFDRILAKGIDDAIDDDEDADDGNDGDDDDVDDDDDGLVFLRSLNRLCGRLDSENNFL